MNGHATHKKGNASRILICFSHDRELTCLHSLIAFEWPGRVAVKV